MFENETFTLHVDLKHCILSALGGMLQASSLNSRASSLQPKEKKTLQHLFNVLPSGAICVRVTVCCKDLRPYTTAGVRFRD